MKKSERKKISPEEALRFLEDMRLLQEGKDGPTKSISLRVPENILKTIKARAKLTNRKYQSLMIHYIRKGLSEDK